jgi:C_GCAxxG_C_C family probable redox protein
MSAAGEKAVEIFLQNYNCSQAVFSTFAERFGLDEKTALKMASPFGGGLARRGELCGAVTGALLALGLARGTDTPASKEEIYRLSQEAMRRFEAEHGSLLCRDLLGYDMSTPAGHQAASEKGVFRSICPEMVRHAAEIVESLLTPA